VEDIADTVGTRSAAITDNAVSKVGDVANTVGTRSAAIADKTVSKVGDVANTVGTRSAAITDNAVSGVEEVATRTEGIVDNAGTAVEELAFGSGADDTDARNAGASPAADEVEDQQATAIEATLVEMTVAEPDVETMEPEADPLLVRGTVTEPDGDDDYNVAAEIEGDSDVRDQPDDFDDF
jgi:hypothetical protein